MERKIVERLLLGDAVKRISRELKVGRTRVREVRTKAQEAGYLDGRTLVPPYPEALFPDVVDGRSIRGSDAWKELLPHSDWIKERLLAGWHAGTVYEELPIKVPTLVTCS